MTVVIGFLAKALLAGCESTRNIFVVYVASWYAVDHILRLVCKDRRSNIIGLFHEEEAEDEGYREPDTTPVLYLKVS